LRDDPFPCDEPGHDDEMDSRQVIAAVRVAVGMIMRGSSVV
jgi:hypothetical protein